MCTQYWETHLRSFEINGLITHKMLLRPPTYLPRTLQFDNTTRYLPPKGKQRQRGDQGGDSISRKIIFYCILYLSIVSKSIRLYWLVDTIKKWKSYWRVVLSLYRVRVDYISLLDAVIITILMFRRHRMFWNCEQTLKYFSCQTFWFMTLIL